MRMRVLGGLLAVALCAVVAAGEEPGSLEGLLKDFGLRPLSGPHCSRQLPSMIETLHRELGPQGLTVWAIDIAEPPARVAAFVESRGLTLPVLLDADGAVTRAYRITGTPTVVLVGRDGQWRARGVGPRDWDTEGRPLLAALLARRP
jgi:hypothetical protein